jgi:hypothetical protein
MPDPLARADDAVPQARRSSSAEQTERLAGFVAELRARTGAGRVALVGNSRGGYPIRDFVVHQGGAAQVSHAITCGTPNRGVYDWEWGPGGEFNGRGPFLRRLNGGDTDVVEAPPFSRSAPTTTSTPSRTGALSAAQARRPASRRTARCCAAPPTCCCPASTIGEPPITGAPSASSSAFIAGREPDTLSCRPSRAYPRRLVSGLEAGGATTASVPAPPRAVRVDPLTGARQGEALPSARHRGGRRLGSRHGRARHLWNRAGRPRAPVSALLPQRPSRRSPTVLHLRPPAALAAAEREVRPRWCASPGRAAISLAARRGAAGRREGGGRAKGVSPASPWPSAPARRPPGAAPFRHVQRGAQGASPCPCRRTGISIAEMTW